MRGTIVVAGVIAMLAGAPSALAASTITDRAVTFAVTNFNQTQIPCSADGAAATVRGTLVLPVGQTPSSVTLYLHGLGFGSFFWRFDAVPGYDYALEQARAGHASLVIDRLGYDRSDHPAGTKSCIGSQATIAHQVVQALRHGRYAISRGTAPGFARVALAGHSLGGLIAEGEAAAFNDVDALAVLAFSDALPSLTALQTFGQTTLDCAKGGTTTEGPGTPGGYAPFGETAKDFDAIMFYDADPAVVSAVNAQRNVDPCGDTSSVPFALAVDAGTLSKIKVPVLLALADHDALFTPPLAKLGAYEFSGAKDLTQITLPGTGHALTLGRSAPAVRRTIGGWLGKHGF